jgi:hypothetical protein
LRRSHIFRISSRAKEQRDRLRLEGDNAPKGVPALPASAIAAARKWRKIQRRKKQLLIKMKTTDAIGEENEERGDVERIDRMSCCPRHGSSSIAVMANGSAHQSMEEDDDDQNQSCVDPCLPRPLPPQPVGFQPATAMFETPALSTPIRPQGPYSQSSSTD